MELPDKCLPESRKRRRQSEEPAIDEKVSRRRTGPGLNDVPAAQTDIMEQYPQEKNPQASSDETSPIEGLPSELRRQILCHLDYEGLRALVHASPIFHAQYLLNHRKLL